jgi:hypothetical protein
MAPLIYEHLLALSRRQAQNMGLMGVAYAPAFYHP